jgi:hypothetical protein
LTAPVSRRRRRVTLVFDSTTAALWAEEVAEDADIPVEVVPAPAGSAAKCDLALETTPDRLRKLEEELQAQGVPYRRWDF